MAQVMTPGGDYGPFCINGRSPIPWDVCVNEIGWKFFIGQGGFNENIPAGKSTKINLKAAKDYNVPVIGEYFWLDPEENPKIIVDRWSKDILDNDPDIVCYDDEQSQKFDGTTFDPQKASDYNQEVMEGIIANFKDKRHCYYGRPGFLTQYRKPLIPFVVSLGEPWFAANPSWGMGRYWLSTDEIISGKTQVVTNYNTKPYLWRWGNLFDDNMGPDMSLYPKGTGWMWQTGGNRMLNGEIWELDWDYWFGDYASLLDWAKKKVVVINPPPVPLTIEEIVANHEKRIQNLEKHLPQQYQIQIPVVLG